MKPSLCRKDLTKRLEEVPLGKSTCEKTLPISTTVLGGSPLQYTWDCDSAKAVFNRLQRRYAGKTMVSKLKALKILLNTKFSNNTDVRDHVAYLKSRFSLLAAMGSTIEESLNVDILLSSVRNHQELAPNI